MHSKKELDQRLLEAGVKPLKKLGQNFLVNPGVCRGIVSAVVKMQPATVVEIGPGLGALTDELITDRWPLFLVEIDSGLVEYWKKKSGEIKVLHQDALRVDWASLSLMKPAVLVSNLPYSIAASLIIELSQLKPQPFHALILMFQKEVALRIEADRNDEDYGMLSVMSQVFWDVERVIDAGPQDFSPVPNVGSRVLKFTSKNASVDPAAFLKFVKLGFSQRRKKLSSNLSGGFSKDEIQSAFDKLDLGEGARAQELSPNRFAELFSVLLSCKG